MLVPTEIFPDGAVDIQHEPLKGKRVILAGGTGLVGRALTTALLAAGARVEVLTRSPGRVVLPAGAEGHPWEELAGLLADAAAVVNLAGEGIADRRWSPDRKRLLCESRTGPTARIVAAIAASRSRPEVLVNASAIGFYGNRPGSPCDEVCAAGEGFFPELCKAWEAAADPVQDLGVRLVKLRIGVVLAREGGALPKMALPVRLLLGAPLGNGHQAISWIHIADLVGLLLAALGDPGYTGPVNATAPNSISQATFLRALGKRLHRPIFPLPGFLTATAVKVLVGEMAGPMLLEGAEVLPRKALDRGFQFRFPTIDRALEDLFGPTSAS
jgi:uncharacterized protein (TIGR01777 family)